MQWLYLSMTFALISWISPLAVMGWDQTLQELIVEDNEVLDDEAIIQRLDQLPSATDLRVIWIEAGARSQITDALLVAIGERCPNLEGLMLHADRITDEGVAALVSRCHDLRLLFLGAHTHGQLTDRTAQLIVDSCNRLAFLDFYQQPFITDVGVEIMLHRCKRLEEFRLTGCFDPTSLIGPELSGSGRVHIPGPLTDRSLDALATYGFRLVSLCLDFNPHITLNGVRKVVESCPNLAFLSAVGVQFDDYALHEMATAFPNLNITWGWPNIQFIGKFFGEDDGGDEECDCGCQDDIPHDHLRQLARRLII